MNGIRGTAAALAAVALVVLAAGVAAAAAKPGRAGGGVRVLDDFETLGAWQARPADGVELRISGDAGLHGRSMRLDFDFVKGGGYAVARRALDLDLPANYRFRFSVRGDCRPQDLEFKLADASGDNVWWMNRHMFRFDPAWRTLGTKKRQITFAWGPSGGGELRHVASIEFAVTAGSGGRGTVWIDDLVLEPLPADTLPPPPVRARASSMARGHPAVLALDGDSATAWRSRPGDERPVLTLDLGAMREFGGLALDWADGRRAGDYAVAASDDGRAWRTLRVVRGGRGARDRLALPESEARWLRVSAAGGVPREGLALAELRIEPLAWAASPIDFFRNLAREAPRGRYPRGVRGEPSFWTIVGANGDPDESLLSGDGAIEPRAGGFSVEPFVRVDGRLWTWADVNPLPILDEARLPIPSVGWFAGSFNLVITATPAPDGAARETWVRYRVRNDAPRPVSGTLDLAVRPFQVNPPSQFLGRPGGPREIRALAIEGGVVRVDGVPAAWSLTPPSDAGVAAFDAGDITDFLAEGRLPDAAAVRDSAGWASGALRYDLTLEPGETRDVVLVLPLDDAPVPPVLPDPDVAARAERRLAEARRGWSAHQDSVRITLPAGGQDAPRAAGTQIGWILVNRDGAGIQPGSRAYARSWIRDGSLTCTALLRWRHTREVREFLEWFAGFQYADGKVPCCVDRRGSDPVPEHDSHGQFIYLAAEYLRHTGDRATVSPLWPHVAAAAAYIDTLRRQRLGPEWRAPGKEPFYGILPPSISHEGYSAKPMHSYWDDLWALRGLRDAAWLAGETGHTAARAPLAALADTFAHDLAASIRAAMTAHGVDYVPGCADLGDFDATSTTMLLEPVQADSLVPRAAVEATFERYWRFFVERRDGEKPWEAFTPYEMRIIGSFVRLGWRDRAIELLDFFLGHRTPAEWEQWAEVVWNAPKEARFIGDLPHTWCGSDYVRSVLDLFAYERESDASLVLAAGLPAHWIPADAPLRVSGLGTWHGPLGYALVRVGRGFQIDLDGGLRVPAGGVAVRLPGVTPAWTAWVDGRTVPVSASGEVVLRASPSRLVLTPPAAR